MARYVNVTGVDAIQRQFDRMSQKAAERVAQALNLSAHEVEQRAKMLAPVGDEKSAASLQYGPLRESIKAELVEEGGKIVAKVTTGRAFYARFVEFGTRRGQRPRPYFWPAYRSVRKKIRRRIRAALNRAAREAVNGG